MFSFLGFIFIFVLIIILFGVAIISGVLKAIFGIGRRANSGNATSGKYSHNKTEESVSNTPDRKKIFDEEEGEYVDFEEIKDE